MKKIYLVWLLQEEFETKKEAEEYIELNFDGDLYNVKLEQREVE